MTSFKFRRGYRLRAEPAVKRAIEILAALLALAFVAGGLWLESGEHDPDETRPARSQAVERF